MKSALIASLLLAPAITLAASQQFGWTPPTDTTGITGYQLRWGLATGVYSAGAAYVAGSSATTGSATTLMPGTTYYVTVRSCGDSTCTKAGGNSNEVSITAPFGVPTGLRVIGGE